MNPYSIQFSGVDELIPLSLQNHVVQFQENQLNLKCEMIPKGTRTRAGTVTRTLHASIN